MVRGPKVAREPTIEDDHHRVFGRNGNEIVPTAESMAIDGHAKCVAALGLSVESVAQELREANRLKREQQEAIGRLVKRWGPWLLASVPVIASAIGGIAPNLADLIGKLAANTP